MHAAARKKQTIKSSSLMLILTTLEYIHDVQLNFKCYLQMDCNLPHVFYIFRKRNMSTQATWVRLQ